MEGLGQQALLCERCEGLDARNNRHRNTRLAATLHEVEIAAVVEKHLRYNIFGSRLDLCAQILDVGIYVHSLLVLFGITRHAEREDIAQRLVL